MEKLKSIVLDKRVMAAAVMALGVTVAVTTFAAGPGARRTAAPGVVNGKGAAQTGAVVTKPKKASDEIRKATEVNGKQLRDVTSKNVQTKAVAGEILLDIPNKRDADRLGSQIKPTKVPGIYKLIVPQSADLEQARRDAEKLPGVKAAEFNSIASVNAYPNDPLYETGQKAYLDLIRLPEAWARNKGVKDVIVAVIDTGYNDTHADLKFKRWINNKEKKDGIDNDNNGYIDDVDGFDFSNALFEGDKLKNDEDGPFDNRFTGEYSYVSGHGTAVASVIAAQTNNSEGIAGVNWRAKIMPLQACNPLCEWEDVANAIVYATDNGAKVINLSLGSLEQGPIIVDKAIDYATSKGVVVVAASGNDGVNQVSYPARHKDVISVGAVDATGKRKYYSNGGEALSVVAPSGVTAAFYKPTKDGESKYQRGVEGTSFSAPVVSGLASLILSERPDLNRKMVKDLIEYSGNEVSFMEDAGRTVGYGLGLIDVERALRWSEKGVVIEKVAERKKIKAKKIQKAKQKKEQQQKKNEQQKKKQQQKKKK